jgi:hypothetical protein
MLITFTNANGENFVIGGNYILSPNWSGFGDSPSDIQSTKAPYQDGETYIDTILSPKELIVEFTIIGSTRQQVFDRRRTVINQFNPKLGPGTLKWTQDDGSEYHIDCVPRSPQFADGQGQSDTHQVVIVSFVAFTPFWYDPSQIQQIMVGFSGGFSFPLSFPISFGQVGSQKDISNSGNVETPVIIYFYGEVVDPTISNLTTDEDIIITETIDDGEILIINTDFGEKSVMVLSGGEYVNAFEYVDPDSVFWKLQPGGNTIKYTVTSEGENAQCRIYYYNRFTGV